MKQAKKLIIVIFTILFSCSSLSVVTAYSNLKAGDYVQMGQYNGAKIIWRCVDIDENGPLMLSDRILSLKSFDAIGSHSNDFENYRYNWGSNLWEQSNIRSWLNSSSSAGNITWNCGNSPSSNNVTCNDYDYEKGFLSGDNFLLNESTLIKTVEQKSLINVADKNSSTIGSEAFSYNYYVMNLENYETGVG